MASEQTSHPLTHAALRLRFKERQKETGGVYQNWQIRVHRALSWLKRADDIPADTLLEARFLLLWIALNSLYSRWNNGDNRPDKDAASRDDFLHRICRLDEQAIGAFLHAHKPAIRKLLGNKYLWNGFWANPDAPDAERLARAEVYHLDGNLARRSFTRVLIPTIQRVALLRGQIVHGAATGGSMLNRQSLTDALTLLSALIPLILHIVIEHAANDDWPDLCYPPVDQ
jgi:hypothetical protein